MSLVGLLRRGLAPAVALVLPALGVSTARAFVVDDFFFRFDAGGIDVQATLVNAARWSAAPLPVFKNEFGQTSFLETGIHDGLQVGIEDGFAEELGASASGEVALIDGTVQAAFDAWVSPVVDFDISFDHPIDQSQAQINPFAGLEIDLFAVPPTHPSLSGGGFIGFASFFQVSLPQRTLTNGTVLPGPLIQGADILLDMDFFQIPFGGSQAAIDAALAFFQSTLMHEIGHTLGLDHPNEFPSANLDTDFDPLNPMIIDPANPFANVIHSPNIDPTTIMRSFITGNTILDNDAIGGRDVLYPALPEPGPALLVLTGAVAFALRRRAGTRE